MLGATTPGRVVITAGIVALAAAAGLLAGKATDEDGGTTELALDQAAPSAPEYERTLNRELEALGATRAAELKRLREARTPAKQATVSRALARAYLRSATVVARRDPLTGLTPSGEAVVEALRGAAIAYRRLGAGAAGEDRSTYEAGRRAVRRAEGLLARRLEADLSAVGTG